MGECIEKFEKKSSLIMTIFVIFQIVIFIVFTVLYLITEWAEEKIEFNIFMSLGLLVFLIYMVHFAYHSVIFLNKIRKAYFIELIAFLIMSTISSILLVYNFFTFVINSGNVDTEYKDLYQALGYTSVVILILGNLIYYVCAYFAYNYFELIFMQKLGAKQIFHNIFSWIQFQHSMVKSDMGMVGIISMALVIFNRSHTAYLIIDITLFVLMICITLTLSRSVLLIKLDKERNQVGHPFNTIRKNKCGRI